MSATTKKAAAPRRQSRGPILHRNCTVTRWGNNLGIRIPREAAERLGLAAGEEVSLEVAQDSITIRPARRRRKWDINELLAGVMPEKVGGEFPWGKPVGKERL